MIEDLPSRYSEYLARFSEQIGEYEVGRFAKHAGKLIKKLTFEEFTPAYLEYTEVIDAYRQSVERGDTINDVVVKVLRERAAALVLPPPSV